VRGDERRLFNEFLTERMNEAISPAGPKTIQIAIPTDGWHVQVRENAAIPSMGLSSVLT
jgi:hypothetical protein